MHRKDLFIVSGADLEYIKKYFKIWWWMMLYRSKCIKKNKKDKMKNVIKSARLSNKTNSWMEFIQIIIYVYLFLGVKLCKINVRHNPSSYQHYDRPCYIFRCNIEPKHFTL